MRIGEKCALQWQDIDFKNKLLKVRGTLVYLRDDKKRFKDSPKTSKNTRDIPMLDNVEQLLKKRKKNQLQSIILLGDKWKTEDSLKDIVFTYDTGGAMWLSAIRVDMKKIVDKINDADIEFEKITPHTFRHTFATRGLERGIPSKVMQTILGHTSLAMTMDLYSHVLPNTKAEEMQKLSGLFK